MISFFVFCESICRSIFPSSDDIHSLQCYIDILIMFAIEAMLLLNFIHVHIFMMALSMTFHEVT